MRTFGNVLWLILGGLFSGLALFFAGFFFCLTIIGIPFGLKCFQLAMFAIWPFGKTVEANFEEHPTANALWLAFGGIGVWLSFAVVGVICAITIIGIPFAKQNFKLARYALSPFGATILDA